MKWPWVIRGQYDAVLSSKEEVIQVLRDQVAALENRLSAPISVSVTLPEGFAVQMPAVVGRRQKPATSDAPRPVARDIDYASIDENDYAAIARIAGDELGGMVSPSVLSRTVNQIKMTIRTAKRKKLEDSLREGRVGTQSRPVALTEEEAIAQGSKYIPTAILEEIENAERG